MIPAPAQAGASPLILFALAIFGLIKYFADQIPKAPKNHDADEQERTRRFLEALGQGKGQTPVRRETPPPLRQRPGLPPAPLRPRQHLPVPPITAPGLPDWSKPRPRRAPGAPPPIPRAPAPHPPRSTVPQPLPEIPDLVTPTVAEFKTVSSSITAMATSRPPLDEPEPEREHPAITEVRALLGSREALRSAFLLREILGPPRGLPSGPGRPSFPSL